MTADHRRLTATLAQILELLALPATDAQRRQLVDLVLMLQRWNSTYNLTAIRDPDAMLVQHIADCLAVIKPLDRQTGERAMSTLLDVGSGAGFPGAVIAVMRPSIHVTCIDSVGKKIAFLRQMAGSLGLTNLIAEHGRVQAYRADAFNVIASRALGELSFFIQLTSHLLGNDGVWMAMKARPPSTDETGELHSMGIRCHVEQLDVPLMEAKRCLVWMNC